MQLNSLLMAALAFIIATQPNFAQSPPAPAAPPKDSLTQCDETIRQKLASNQAQYAYDLGLLMKAFQAKGDLENLLLVKKEQELALTTTRIEEEDIVQKPVELRTLQMKYKAMQEKISQQTVKEFLTMLEARKKKLTVAGKLDEALAAKQDIETIQTRYSVSIGSVAPPPGAVPAPKQSPTAPAGTIPTQKKLPMTAQIKMSVSLQKADKSPTYYTSSYYLRHHLSIQVRNTGMEILSITIRWKVSCRDSAVYTASGEKVSDEQTITLKPLEQTAVNTPDYRGVTGYVVEAVVDGKVVAACTR